MNVARQNHVAALLQNGSVLVAGGHPGNNTPTNTAEVYSPATGTWTTVGAMGTARRLFGACTLANGKVLVAGGNSGAGDVTSAELFDPSANTWSSTGSLAAAREDFSITCLSDGRVLVAGGSGPSGLLNSAEIYSPTSGTWSSAGTMPAAVHTQGAVLLNDGRVLVAGGNNASGPVKTAAIWSPSTNAWTATGSMGTTRAFYALNILSDGRVLAAGGLVNVLLTTTKTTEIYSPSAGTWSAAANLNTARYSGASATLAAGPIVVGGVNGGSPLATSESYDSVHNTWTQVATAYGAVNQTATALTPTSVLVAGGNTGSNATTSAQMYGILNVFALYAQRSVTLGSSDHINGGDVGVAAAGPSAFGPQLVVGSSATVQTNHNLVAPSVSLGSQAHVGDVQTNSLTNSGGTLGTQAPYPSSMPVPPLALPTGPGGSNVSVPALTTTTLNPSNYGALSVTGTVYLNPGKYTFASVTMADQAHLAGVSGTATVSVTGTFQAGNSVSISSPGATPAGQLVISVAGYDSGTTPALSIGTGAAMSAILSAPHGTLSIGANTLASGAFSGFDLKLGSGVTINFQNGFVGGASQHGTQQLSGYITPAMAAAPLVGPVPPTTPISLALALPVQAPAGQPTLSAFAHQVSDPTNSSYHQFLTPAQFVATYSPTTSDYSNLQTFATSNGLTVLNTHGNRTLLDVTGTAAQIEAMTSTNLNYYLRPDGTQFFGPDRQPSVNLTLPLLRVAGLDNYAVATPAGGCSPPSGSGPGSGPNGLFLGNDFRNAYLSSCLTSNLNGSGESIGLFELQGYNSNDIQAYINAAGLPGLTITTVTYSATGIASLFASSLSPNGNTEAPVDIEVAHAMAPGAQIVVYQASDATVAGVNLGDDLLNAMAYPDTVGAPFSRSNSSSWFYTDSFDSAGQQSLDQMAAQGQSFFQASGDSGASVFGPGDNRVANNAVLVGGTKMTAFGGGVAPTETTWADSNSGGTGGYYGPFSPLPFGSVGIPDYQNNSTFITASNFASPTYRNVPDVSMLAAENIEAIYTSAGGTAGTVCYGNGTSVAAPLWAGYMALVNQEAATIFGNGVNNGHGFLNPTLYAIAKTSLYGSCFNDITTGSDAFLSGSAPSGVPSTGFPAVPGYDLATGLGSPTCGLIRQLTAPHPTTPATCPSGTTLCGLVCCSGTCSNNVCSPPSGGGGGGGGSVTLTVNATGFTDDGPDICISAPGGFFPPGTLAQWTLTNVPGIGPGGVVTLGSSSDAKQTDATTGAYSVSINKIGNKITCGTFSPSNGNVTVTVSDAATNQPLTDSMTIPQCFWCADVACPGLAGLGPTCP